MSHRSLSVVRCEGNLDASKMVNVKNRLSRLLNQNRKLLLLDFARTEQIDVTGLGILVDRIRKFRALKGDVCFCSLRPSVFETIHEMGVDGMVETFNTEEEARRSFQVA